MLNATLVLASFRKDLARRLRDPFALLLWIGIPILIGGLIVLAFGGSNGPAPKAHVFLVDRDDSFVSRLIVSALSSDQAQVIAAETLPEDEARARMDAGEASALLLIPEGFGDAVLEERPMRLELLTNPAQRILPGIVATGLEILCEGTFYLHRVLGDEISAMTASARGSGGLADLQTAEASVRIRHDMERIAPFLFPPVIALESTVRDEPAGTPAGERSLGAFFFPSMLLMALMFMAEGLADDVWRERSLGVLRRVAVGPFGAAPVLLGKLLAGWVLMLGVCAIGLVIAALAFDIPAVRVVPAALWASTAGAVLLALMLTLKLFATSQRTAGLIGNLLLFPLIMLGGSMMPFEAMPAWLGVIGRRTPNGWSMEVLKQIVFGEPTLAGVGGALAALLAAGALLVAISSARMRAFARGG